MRLFLPFDTDSDAPPSGGFRALTTNLEVEAVPDTTLHLHLLHPLDVVSEVGGEIGTCPVEVFAGSTVEATVKHPDWDAVLGWVLDDGDDLLFFGWSKGTGAAERV